LVLTHDHHRREAHNNLGFALRGVGSLEEAFQHCSKAVEIDAKYKSGHKNLGLIQCDQGKFEEGKMSLELAIKLDPKLNKDDVKAALANAKKELKK
jgi:tetratricopeptide (TPR) repeat protein